VTTCATTALGSGVPILLVPAMHLSMYDHKIVQKNIKICKDHGVLFLDPSISGNKAKSPEVLEIVETVIRTIGKQDLKHKKILIIGGATAEPIDDIRVLTNRSSGKTAIALSINAFERGADVELWYGYSPEPVPSYIEFKHFQTVHDLFVLLKEKRVKQFDGVIICAAIANYIPKKQKGKIPSGKETLTIDCSQAPVVLQTLRSQLPQAKIIAFKTEGEKKNILRRTQRLLSIYHLDGAIGNTLDGFGGVHNEILLLTKKGKSTWKKGKKEELASVILDMIR
jgi:phosphopantothenoylcysteine decarboxylase/phosphopantothenate--cysteine ligase